MPGPSSGREGWRGCGGGKGFGGHGEQSLGDALQLSPHLLGVEGGLCGLVIGIGRGRVGAVEESVGCWANVPKRVHGEGHSGHSIGEEGGDKVLGCGAGGGAGKLDTAKFMQFLLAVHPLEWGLGAGWSAGGLETCHCDVNGQALDGVGGDLGDGCWGQVQGHISWSSCGVLWEQECWFSLDCLGSVCPSGWLGQAVTDEVDCVPDPVVQGFFAQARALEQVVSMFVQGPPATFWAGGAPHGRWEARQPELALQHGGDVGVGKSVVRVGSIVVSQWQRCVWGGQGWHGMLDLRWSILSGLVECGVSHAGTPCG